MRQRITIFLLLGALLVAGCTGSTRNMALDQALMQYGKYLRWSEYESALRLHHPQYLADNPVSSLDIERLKLFRVTGYTPAERNMSADGTVVEQRVVLRMYNAANAREISIVQNQLWKFDPELKRWLLHSNLPDVTQRRQ